MPNSLSLVYRSISKKNPGATKFSALEANRINYEIQALDIQNEGNFFEEVSLKSFGERVNPKIIISNTNLYIDTLSLAGWNDWLKYTHRHSNVTAVFQDSIAEAYNINKLAKSVISILSELRHDEEKFSHKSIFHKRTAKDEISIRDVVSKTCISDNSFLYKPDDLFLILEKSYGENILTLSEPQYLRFRDAKFDNIFNRSIYSYDSEELFHLKYAMEKAMPDAIEYIDSLLDLVRRVNARQEPHYDQRAFVLYKCFQSLNNSRDLQSMHKLKEDDLLILALSKEMESRFCDTKGNKNKLEKYLSDSRSFIKNHVGKSSEFLISDYLKGRFYDAFDHTYTDIGHYKF